ncbi:MAG: hypothetical protein R8J84_01115 [Mariprofundales bacterium]
MPLSIALVLASFVVMAAAWRWRGCLRLHVPLMAAVMLFDLLFPIWLYLTHDWKHRLIDEGDILSFGVWAHWGLALMLLVLYVLQIGVGRNLLQGAAAKRQDHRNQAMGIVWLRVIVFASGAMLMNPA